MCGSCPSQTSVLFVVSEWFVLWCDSQKRLLTVKPQCMPSPLIFAWTLIVIRAEGVKRTLVNSNRYISVNNCHIGHQFTIVKCSCSRPAYDLVLHQNLAQHRRAGSSGQDSAVQQNLNEKRHSWGYSYAHMGTYCDMSCWEEVWLNSGWQF